ncbi:permease prefix domain 1-containing protein [Paenibacillus tarimensis]|uniref:permease prefix domain 1-containing protein n=1 Tax=Paenibacillus tarimensis TaxID=416012 RepID=UPI001F43B6EE|nr:permease prefix domain 1-containing protein [Paenibacillus tarimensis]MCF2945748.1 permease prefix domain 1-containing protein [Paenibacillus tarimensis]
MKQIDEYVDSVYANLDGTEAEELKEEMRAHLLQAAQELMADGNTEEEAVKIAVERFGDERMIRGQVAEYFQIPRMFAVNVLRAAIVFATLGILLGCLFAYNEYQLTGEREHVKQQALEVLSVGPEISEESKRELVKIADAAPQIKSLEISLANSNPADADLLYREPFSHVMYWNATAGEAVSDGIWDVRISYEHYQLAWINSIMVCLVIYWVLFAIWAVVQAYRTRKLGAFWIIAISLFNIPAYLVYRARH